LLYFSADRKQHLIYLFIYQQPTPQPTNTTTTTTTTTMPLALSTPTSHESFDAAGGQGTNTRVGESKVKQPSLQESTQPMLQQEWKPSSVPRPESSSTYTTKKETNSTLCEDEEECKEEIDQRKREMEGYVEAQKVEPKKKKRHRGSKKEGPTENHLKLRAAADAERKWEQDLKTVVGLSELEVSLCMQIVAKHHQSDSFPDSDPKENQRFLDFAREGWRHTREAHKIMEKHPECLDQTCIDGKWYMEDEL
jgi:hypothetical protein